MSCLEGAECRPKLDERGGAGDEIMENASGSALILTNQRLIWLKPQRSCQANGLGLGLLYCQESIECHALNPLLVVLGDGEQRLDCPRVFQLSKGPYGGSS